VIAYRDFAPQPIEGRWYRGTSYETFDAAIAAANAWMAAERITPLHVETVVLPNLTASSESGTADGELATVSGWATWYQFVRVWYSVR